MVGRRTMESRVESRGRRGESDGTAGWIFCFLYAVIFFVRRCAGIALNIHVRAHGYLPMSCRQKKAFLAGRILFPMCPGQR